MNTIKPGDKLVDWRNHSWFVINPNKQTMRGATGDSDGQYRKYRVDNNRIIIRGEFAEHYPKAV